jgi:hypothetical protein
MKWMAGLAMAAVVFGPRVAVAGAANDFNGDGASDLATYRAASGTWYVRTLEGEVLENGTSWGPANGWAVPADYSGNGAADLATYDPATCKWYVRESGALGYAPAGWVYFDWPWAFDASSGTWYWFSLASSGEEQWVYGFGGASAGWNTLSESGVAQGWGFFDWPWAYSANDDAWSYLQEGGGQLAVDMAEGNWYQFGSGAAVVADGVEWGFPGGIPVPGDYDGDGRADLGVYDPVGGGWYVRTLADLDAAALHFGTQWGFNGPVHPLGPTAKTVIPLPYDFDEDGIVDLAYYYRGTGMGDTTWNVLGSKDGRQASYVWGSSGSIPAPGKYRSIMDYPAGIAVYKVKYSPGQTDDGTFNTPYMHQFKMGTYGSTLPVAGHDFDGNGWDDHCVYNYGTGAWTIYLNDGLGNGALPDGQTYEQPPTRVVPWGGAGDVPADIFTSLLKACGYGVAPW